MIKLLRQHLIKNNKLVSMLDKKDGIFYIDKPKKRDDKTYIVIHDTLLSEKYIEDYKLKFHIVSPEPRKIKDIEIELRKYLNDPRDEKMIFNNDTYIRNIKTLNGGGITRTEEGDFLGIVYFIAKNK